MFIFTPNTLIKSSEVNANFDETLNIAYHENPYYFYATLTSTQVTVAGAMTKLNFATEISDPNSNFNTTDKQYTIPVSGIYSFTVTALLEAQAGATFILALALDSSTVEYRRLAEIPNTTGNITINGTDEEYYYAGAKIAALYYSGTATKNIYSGSQYTRFHGRLVTTSVAP